MRPVGDAGDSWGRAAAYDAYADGLHTYAMWSLRDHDGAADALYCAFVLADRHITQLREPDHVQPWLYALARREIQLRANGAPAPAPASVRLRPPGGTADPVGSLAALERSLRRAEFNSLEWPESAGLMRVHREVLELTIRHGLDSRAVGQVLGLGQGGAGSGTAGLAGSAGAAGARGFGVLADAWRELERSLAAVAVAKGDRRHCARLAELTHGWSGKLTPALREPLTDHVEQCPRCRYQVRTVVGTPTAPTLLPFVAAPRALRGLLLAELSDPAAALAAGMDHESIAARIDAFTTEGFPVIGGNGLPHRRAAARRAPRRAPAGRAGAARPAGSASTPTPNPVPAPAAAGAVQRGPRPTGPLVRDPLPTYEVGPRTRSPLSTAPGRAPGAVRAGMAPRTDAGHGPIVGVDPLGHPAGPTANPRPGEEGGAGDLLMDAFWSRRDGSWQDSGSRYAESALRPGPAGSHDPAGPSDPTGLAGRGSGPGGAGSGGALAGSGGRPLPDGDPDPDGGPDGASDDEVAAAAADADGTAAAAAGARQSTDDGADRAAAHRDAPGGERGAGIERRAIAPVSASSPYSAARRPEAWRDSGSRYADSAQRRDPAGSDRARAQPAAGRGPGGGRTDGWRDSGSRYAESAQRGPAVGGGSRAAEVDSFDALLSSFDQHRPSAVSASSRAAVPTDQADAGQPPDDHPTGEPEAPAAQASGADRMSEVGASVADAVDRDAIAEGTVIASVAVEDATPAQESAPTRIDASRSADPDTTVLPVVPPTTGRRERPSSASWVDPGSRYAGAAHRPDGAAAKRPSFFDDDTLDHGLGGGRSGAGAQWAQTVLPPHSSDHRSGGTAFVSTPSGRFAFRAPGAEDADGGPGSTADFATSPPARFPTVRRRSGGKAAKSAADTAVLKAVRASSDPDRTQRLPLIPGFDVPGFDAAATAADPAAADGADGAGGKARPRHKSRPVRQAVVSAVALGAVGAVAAATAALFGLTSADHMNVEGPPQGDPAAAGPAGAGGLNLPVGTSPRSSSADPGSPSASASGAASTSPAAPAAATVQPGAGAAGFHVSVNQRSAGPGSVEILLRNSSGTPLSWSATPRQGWIRLSRSSGTLAAGGSVVVTASATSAAPRGQWTATVVFAPGNQVVALHGVTAASPPPHSSPPAAPPTSAPPPSTPPATPPPTTPSTPPSTPPTSDGPTTQPSQSVGGTPPPASPSDTAAPVSGT